MHRIAMLSLDNDMRLMSADKLKTVLCASRSCRFRNRWRREAGRTSATPAPTRHLVDPTFLIAPSLRHSAPSPVFATIAGRGGEGRKTGGAPESAGTTFFPLLLVAGGKSPRFSWICRNHGLKSHRVARRSRAAMPAVLTRR